MQKQMVREICFGPYLDLKETLIQAQLIHQLLLRQVKQQNINELWFNISGKLVRFSIEEFCLISGLRCVDNGDFTKYRMRDSTIKEKYFKKYDSISTECVENVFKELPSDTVDK
ncbi:DUF1985 domain-containing protein [Abeliophyllum distichum]|uniref:DUF1985 domain-containing protein n=1 Tax=Abeliophyllum distichum TaxID=126358 RepID=A0ABD1PDH8_9LAMI